MYEIYLDDKVLGYPGDPEASVTNPMLYMALNDAGYCEMTVPPSNPLYSELKERQSMIQILNNDKEIFNGEVRDIDENKWKEKKIYVVGELSFLSCSIQPQARFQNATPLDFFTALINEHNRQVEERKQFQVGIVTVVDSNDSIYRYTNYEDTLTALRKKLCDSLGGYLRIRKENGIRYIDCVRLQDYGKSSLQPIKFGVNMLDYAKNITAESIATAVIPLGAKLNESKVEGLDAYVDITSDNNGIDYVYIPSAVEQFGWVKRTVRWNDVTEPANLKRKGEEWLSAKQYSEMALHLTALDLSELNRNIDSYEVGDMVHALSEPYGMDIWFPVQEKTRYLWDPERNKVVLSNTVEKTYTKQAASMNANLKNEIPQKSDWLEAAKANSSELIKAATNGYIMLKMNNNGNPQELLIMDTNDIETAQKVWRWNINGLGYSSSGYNGTYKTAITLDGKIVADFILIGTMLADRIKGGTLTIGGLNNENGIIKIVDAEGNQIGIWDKDGLSAKGSFLSDGKTIIGGVEYNQDYEIKGGHGTISLDGEQAYRYGVVGTGSLDKTGILHAVSLSRLIFAFMDESGTVTDIVYQLNNGYNPNGMTEKNIFNKDVRAVEGVNTPFIQFTDNGTSVDESKWGRIRGSSTGQIVCETDLFVTGTLYTASGTVSASDKGLKKYIKALDKTRAAEFIYSLIPSRYKYRKGKRYHHGFIAQEVKEAMGDDDWGLYIESLNEAGKEYKALRYEELIADIVATVQSQNDRINKLEERMGTQNG